MEENPRNGNETGVGEEENFVFEKKKKKNRTEPK